jgi:hypothetical protein
MSAVDNRPQRNFNDVVVVKACGATTLEGGEK